MERALKSFLDGISEDDNVVNLETVKNDNDDDQPQEGVIVQGSASGMLDMRAMAKRYQEMSTSDIERPAKPAVEAPLPGNLVRPTLLAPVVETDDPDEGRGWLIAGVALAVLVTIVSTAAITAVIVKRSVLAEIREMGIQPQDTVSQTTSTVASAAATTPAVVGEGTDEVAEWPEGDPSLVPAATKDEEEEPHLEMNFRESDVAVVEKRPKRDPVPATTTTTPEPVVTTPAPTLVKEPTTAPPPTEEPAATGPTPKVAKDGEPCDEVLCLVEGRGCCGSAKKAPEPVAEVDTSLPERLGRDDIKAGLAKIDGRLNSCGVRFETTGVVTLKLTIGGDGKVKNSSASKGNDEFQSCISSTLKKARFAKTQEGGKLNYPVILR